ncbi:hypothetical protein [Duganella violaceipulchra]|uniref:HTTM domain-containing protein n=1 Tax=Duganella violaceipulchra TaxID=2849652 RepID=A0AA41L1M6_9BURK|nr:hypothetical protein [Duganella violaceicalia]MBV6325091.1 hypothetical protein [Duganella violaceicalia]MCP2010605.1 hypothetical protein [Duganella violaceicalia]
MATLQWYDLLVRLIVTSILVHDALYVCRDGKDYLLSCILPTFGLHLSSAGKLAVHAGLLLACVAIFCSPQTTYLYPVCLVFLSLKIASYSLRLANHMIFAWFLLLLLCIAAARAGGAATIVAEVPMVAQGVQAMVLVLYFFAFFHKLNREYFQADVSCATALVDFFCWDRKITHPRLLHFYRNFGIYGTVILEGLIPLMLYFNDARGPGLIIAVIFHFILALMGIVNFSMFMYAGLFAFVAPATYHSALLAWSSANAGMLATASLGVLLIVWRWTPRNAATHCSYVYRKPAWLIQSAFGVLTACFLFLCLFVLQDAPTAPRPWEAVPDSERLILTVLLAAFILNGIGPYLGYKTEFSFAMFSNLRLTPWSHLVVPAGWRIVRQPQYVEVKSISGLPTSAAVQGNRAAMLALHVLSRPSEFLYSRYFFREALRALHSSVSPAPQINVSFVELGEQHEMTGFEPEKLGFCLPVNRYPFVMPRASNVRHSEQGSIVPVGSTRQLF